MKIPERLEPLVEQGIVQEVIRPLMSGKEASLYIVYADDDYCVAKVYKDAQHRSFRQRAGYTEGRRIRNSRQRRAMEKGTRFGKEQMEAAWQNAEVDALYRLSAAGLRVPRPHLFTDGVLLMDLVLDADGQPAPRLWDVEFTEEEAMGVHAFLVHQSVLMLCAGMVHGDLSEYNVLLAWDGPMIIDLPQATDAASNPNSRRLFLRDVENFTNFLARFAPALAETRFGPEIWEKFERAELFPDTKLTGRWRGSDRKADTRAVLREIDAAAQEARRKRGDADERSTPQRGPREGNVPPREEPRRDEQERGGRDQPRGGREQPRAGREQPRAGREQPRAGREQTRAGREQPRGGREQPRDGREQPRAPRRDAPPPSPRANTAPSRPPPGRAMDDLDLDDLDALLVEDAPARRR